MPNALSIKEPETVNVEGIPRNITDAERRVVVDLLQEFSQFTTMRSMFAQQWEEAAELILPTSRNTFFYQNYNTPGVKKTQQQIDASGGLALHRFCAIADSLVTPVNMKWHGLCANNEYVMKNRDTRVWFENTTNRLFKYRYATISGFAGQNYNNWQSLGAFGNSTMFVDKFDGRNYHGARGLRYKSVPLGETFFGENHQGKVDRVIRWFRLTAYQAVQKWGIGALPANLISPLKENSQWPYNFLHCVKPRADYDPKRIDAKGMPFGSYYVSVEGQCLMAPEGGYRVFPYAVSRYDQTPGEVYGRGPAQIVLPALKTLNATKKIFLKQGHRAGDPVLLTNDDGAMGWNLKPGSTNSGGVTSDGKALVHVLPTGNIQITEKMMEMERALIDDTFLVSLFKVLSEHPDMTATQVIELVNEKGMLVAPTLGRQHSDYVGSLVERELDLMVEQGLLDPMPPRLREARGEYEVVDTSPLAMARRAGEAAGFVRTVESVKELVNITQDMSLLDTFAFDRAIPKIAEIQNTPIDWMATDKEIADKRKARAQSQARQAQIQAMPAQAAMMKAQAAVNKNQPGIAQGQPFGGPQQPQGAA
jgi:hypothetical protein